MFESEKELSEYTQETEKNFPKESAVDGGVLRALRRHVLERGKSRFTQHQRSQPGKSNRRHGLSRAFHSKVPIPSRDCGDAPEVLSHPHLTMSFSPHALKVNSPANAPLLCFTPLTKRITSPSLTSAAAQRSCKTAVHRCVTRQQLRVVYHPPLSSFPPLRFLANSHIRLINHIGHMRDLPRPTGVRFPRRVGLFPLFQPRASMRVWRVIFPVG